MDVFFEKYITFAKKEEDEDDDDMVMYHKVLVKKDLTSNGPFNGEKYMNVNLNKMTGDIIFNLKQGGCRMLNIKNETITFVREMKRTIIENIDSDDTYIPIDSKACKTSLKFV